VSILWKNETGLMLAGEDGLAKTCLCCPCKAWSIAVACKIDNPYPCDNPQSPCNYDIDFYDTDVCDGVTRGVLTGTVIDYKRWVESSAGFDGTATFTFRIDGQAMNTPETISITEGNPFSWDTDVANSTLEEGMHRLSIEAALYNSSTGLTNVETRCICLYVFDAGTVANHTVMIVPDAIFSGSPCISTTLQFIRIKGPFESYEDAEYVADRWDGLIQAYAETCACDEECCGLSDDAMNAFGEGNSSCLNINRFTSWRCSSEMTWTIIANIEGGTLFLSYFEDGAWVDVWTIGDNPSIAVIPPCKRVCFRVESEGEWTASVNVYDGGAPCPECCLTDPASHYKDEEWDYTPWDDPYPPTGVPNSTDNLQDHYDYLRSLE